MKERMLQRYLESFSKRYGMTVARPEWINDRHVRVGVMNDTQKGGEYTRHASLSLYWNGARWSLRKIARSGKVITSTQL